MIATIEELKQHKEKLKNAIDKAIEEFESETGTGFESISFYHFDSAHDHIHRARVSEIKVII